VLSMTVVNSFTAIPVFINTNTRVQVLIFGPPLSNSFPVCCAPHAPDLLSQLGLGSGASTDAYLFTAARRLSTAANELCIWLCRR
jgi:hypothetical protein